MIDVPQHHEQLSAGDWKLIVCVPGTEVLKSSTATALSLSRGFRNQPYPDLATPNRFLIIIKKLVF